MAPKMEDRSLGWKLASVRRNVDIVARKRSDEADDAAFTYPPADKVFAAVLKQLDRVHVLALPGRVFSEVVEGDKRRVAIKVHLENVDAPQEVREVEGVGEGKDSASAATAAFKWALLATFLIRTEEPEARDAHEARARQVRDKPAMTPTQRRRFIAPAATDAGLSDAELLRLASDILGLEVPLNDLNGFPQDKVDALVKAIKERGPVAA